VEQCIYISFEHGIGVNSLLTAGLPIQAMILLRSQFEAVVRAYWLLFLASNHQVSKLNFSYTFEEQFQSDTCPMVSEMLEALKKAKKEVVVVREIEDSDEEEEDPAQLQIEHNKLKEEFEALKKKFEAMQSPPPTPAPVKSILSIIDDSDEEGEGEVETIKIKDNKIMSALECECEFVE
jgi:hypothetical protein